MKALLITILLFSGSISVHAYKVQTVIQPDGKPMQCVTVGMQTTCN